MSDETSTPNADDSTVSTSDVAQSTETHPSFLQELEARVIWLEKELRKLLALPEDAPID